MFTTWSTLHCQSKRELELSDQRKIAMAQWRSYSREPPWNTSLLRRCQDSTGPCRPVDVSGQLEQVIRVSNPSVDRRVRGPHQGIIRPVNFRDIPLSLIFTSIYGLQLPVSVNVS